MFQTLQFAMLDITPEQHSTKQYPECIYACRLTHDVVFIRID